MVPNKAAPPPLGESLKAARSARKLTLDDLARRSGVSKSMLSQIERGRVNPTFAVLWNLTQALGVDFSNLVEGAAGKQRRSALIEHLKAYATPVIKSADGLCELLILSPPKTPLPVEWYRMSVRPGGALTSEAHMDGTREHLTCFTGELSVGVGDARYPVLAGETVRYFADRPHAIRNDGAEEAEGLLVVALPG